MINHGFRGLFFRLEIFVEYFDVFSNLFKFFQYTA
jgi:hypothetical protein